MMPNQTTTRPPARELSPIELLRVIEFENGADTFADADRIASLNESIRRWETRLTRFDGTGRAPYIKHMLTLLRARRAEATRTTSDSETGEQR